MNIARCLVFFYAIIAGNFLYAQEGKQFQVAYSFGMQRMDFFHQLGLSLSTRCFSVELQQAIGQRSGASRTLFSQTGVQGSYKFPLKAVEFCPYLRLNYGRLGQPFVFNYYRVELGHQFSLPLNRLHIFPLDPFLSTGISQAWEQQNKVVHSFLDFSLYLGVRYAFD